jgi:hypothetical protein
VGIGTLCAITAVIVVLAGRDAGTSVAPAITSAAIDSENSLNADDTPTQVDTDGIAPPQNVVGRCVTKTKSFIITCGGSVAAYKIVDVSASDCGGNTNSKPYFRGGFLCLERTLFEAPPAPVQPVLYVTCFTAGKYAPKCTTKNTASWSYEMCSVAGGAVLQQFLNGSWRTVKQGISKKDDCLPKYPWTVKFDRKAKGVGTKKYRVYFPANDRYSATIEQITVTVRLLRSRVAD